MCSVPGLLLVVAVSANGVRGTGVVLAFTGGSFEARRDWPGAADVVNGHWLLAGTGLLCCRTPAGLEGTTVSVGRKGVKPAAQELAGPPGRSSIARGIVGIVSLKQVIALFESYKIQLHFRDKVVRFSMHLF